MARRKLKLPATNNLVVVSDLHCGCRVGLCPSDGVPLDDGGRYLPSKVQLKLAGHWEEFWGEWVPSVTHGEPFAIAVNGDTMDGVHHGSVTQVSHNLVDQREIARRIIAPLVELCEGRLYMIRGTEAHVGKSAQEEEELARSLGAIPNEDGQHSRWEMWARVGRGLVHLTHHIGTTGRTHYESSAPMGEMGEAFVEAGRWNNEFPDVVVRSHRHRYIKVSIPTHKGETIVCVTPGWQLKTPFVYKIPGGRQSQPQIGGLLVRCGDEDVFTRAKVWSLDRPKEVRI